MAEILTPCCPLCGEPPMVVFGGVQAWCGNDACTILTWTPTKSLDDNLTDASVVKLPPMEDEDHG
jgi:hypothetical protein